MQSGKKGVVIPISFGFTSAFLLEGSRYVLVDSGTPGSAAIILTELSKRGIEPEQVSLIIITHGHWGHSGDLELLKEKTKAPVAAHADEAEALRRGADLHLKPAGLSGRLVKLFAKEKKRCRPVEIDVLVHKEFDLKPYGLKGKIISTPGHTPGSLSVILAGGEAIIGDLLTGGFIRRQKPRYPFFAHDLKRLERSIKMILKLKPTILYTSRGGPLKPEDVARLIKNKDRQTDRRPGKKDKP